jgi:hypothetical protein
MIRERTAGKAPQFLNFSALTQRMATSHLLHGANPRTLVFALVLIGAGDFLVAWTSTSQADDGADCFNAKLRDWLVQEACYRANYQHCLRRHQLGAPLDANCRALLENPPLAKGDCSEEDHFNNRPGCAPPKARD